VIGEILADVPDISFVRFGGEDVVRHKLVQRIVAAYGEYSEQDTGEPRGESGAGGDGRRA
jgi:phosphate starvation-inducible protein PhoH and related proteins